LHVVGTNSDGVWTGNPLELLIRVLPAWYQTVWFMAAAATAVWVLFWGFLQARTVILRRRGAELEAIVSARTAELLQPNEALLGARAALERLAEEDSLTGLANRRMLRARLDRAVARVQRYHGQVAVLFIDLDGSRRLMTATAITPAMRCCAKWPIACACVCARSTRSLGWAATSS